MEKKVTEFFTVQSYEADLSKRMKPFFLQNHLQEAAYAGSAFCGAGYDTLRELNISWVLNRLHLSFNGFPVWGDEVRLDTWSRARQGLLWHRNFQMFKGPELIMNGTSAWTVLDLGTRSLYRGFPPFNEESHLEEDTLPFCTKLIVPKEIEMDPAGSHTPLFSEIDTNLHVNNCFYTQWALDSLPFDYLSKHILKDLEINYFFEIPPRRTIDFQLGRRGDTWYFRGLSGASSLFLVKLEF